MASALLAQVALLAVCGSLLSARVKADCFQQRQQCLHLSDQATQAMASVTPNTTAYCLKLDDYIACMTDNTTCETGMSYYGDYVVRYVNLYSNCGPRGSYRCNAEHEKCKAIHNLATIQLSATNQLLNYCPDLERAIACLAAIDEDCGWRSSIARDKYMWETSKEKMCPEDLSGGTNCPQAFSCIVEASKNSGASTSGVSVLTYCHTATNLIPCVDLVLPDCGILPRTSYSWLEVGDMWTAMCEKVVPNAALSQCDVLKTCTSAIQLPEDMEEMVRNFYNPAFWCTLLLEVEVCSMRAAPACGLSNLTLTLDFLQDQVDLARELCYGPNATFMMDETTVITMEVTSASPVTKRGSDAVLMTSQTTLTVTLENPAPPAVYAGTWSLAVAAVLSVVGVLDI